ncbi:hypothetical protein MPC4_140080 [Methylocella tundrae]|uniref:Uncharacterized protein n=1 Tax=Methylocella tundrae TaxID=227605 RepID=A0A8B6M2C9_METTU|nr:hypothetical protein MPC4_140080 [Methylocella tundrae]
MASAASFFFPVAMISEVARLRMEQDVGAAQPTADATKRRRWADFSAIPRENTGSFIISACMKRFDEPWRATAR